ncbi:MULTISPECIES: hypothetical protein [Streptomyces]|uniref:Uncharacterized protein n=1 Tax=Streptomyces luteosporeus TaxID=173856 RepID=A0ABN3TXQ5_9ACTN
MGRHAKGSTNRAHLTRAGIRWFLRLIIAILAAVAGAATRWGLEVVSHML